MKHRMMPGRRRVLGIGADSSEEGSKLDDGLTLAAGIAGLALIPIAYMNGAPVLGGFVLGQAVAGLVGYAISPVVGSAVGLGNVIRTILIVRK